MDAVESKVVWRDGMAFDAHLEGFEFIIDADEQFGGQGLGPKPKGLTLTSLIGCTGMDVIAILKKMRVEVEGFEVSSVGTLADEHPKKFERITRWSPPWRSPVKSGSTASESRMSRWPPLPRSSGRLVRPREHERPRDEQELKR